MWALSSNVSHVVPIIPKPTKPPVRTLPRLVVSATKGNDDDNIGASGRTILTALESNARATEVEGKSKPATAQISGSDVLWAVTKVAEKKNKRRKKKNRAESLSSAAGRREELSGNDSDDDVRPLVVKSKWAGKLIELEKRLGELYDTK